MSTSMDDRQKMKISDLGISGWPDPRLGVRGLMILAFWVLLNGCSDMSVGSQPLDRSLDVLDLARREGVNDFSCPGAKVVDSSLKRVKEGDWEDGLFSDYLVQVKGCGHEGYYRITCRAGGLCSVAE
jgi:hypothetical protein